MRFPLLREKTLMLNFRHILYIICFLLWALPLKAQEYIESFNADIMVNPNGSLNIEETITVYHEGIKIRRGIYRDLSTSKGERYKILNVWRNGALEPWFVERQSSILRLNTGDDELLASPATSTYVINYIMYDALRPIKGENANELYLNITGKWGFPINHVKAEVRYPPDTGIIRQYSYLPNQTLQHTPDTPFEFFNLAPYEEVTIAQAFTKGTVEIPFPQTYRLLITAFISMFVYYLLAWFFFGKDPAPRAIVPDWEIPKDLSPLECAFIDNNGTIPNNSFFIHVIWLLQQKVINILENKGTGFLGQKTMYTLTTAEKQETSNQEIQLYSQNFPNVLTITANPSEHLARYQQNLTNQLSEKLEKKYYHKRSLLTAIGAFIMPLACLYLFPETIPMPLVVFTMIASPAIYSKNMWPLLFVAVIATPVMYLYLSNTGDYIWPAVFYGYFVLIVIFTHIMFQPTLIGQRQKEKIEGLKMFLKAVSHSTPVPDTDKDNPEKKTLTMEKRITPQDMDNLFPYAVALGLEKEWSKRYSDFFGYATVVKNTRDPWYQSKFRTDFSHCCKSTTASQHTSSGIHSSGLGSSGGGFSGGGFGGGGGGGR